MKILMFYISTQATKMSICVRIYFDLVVSFVFIGYLSSGAARLWVGHLFCPTNYIRFGLALLFRFCMLLIFFFWYIFALLLLMLLLFMCIYAILLSCFVIYFHEQQQQHQYLLQRFGGAMVHTNHSLSICQPFNNKRDAPHDVRKK